VPHAGEAAGPVSVRGALDALQADRIRHGIRAAADQPGVVLDVCPVSNLRTKVVPSLAEHPLSALVDAGVPCTVSTDDPAMFDTDLSKAYAAALELGVSPASCYRAGVKGALCDDQLKAELAGRWPA
jgi:aminodeoxyfutalosine deaminase